MYAVNVRFFDAFNKNSLKGNEYFYLAYDMVPVGATVVVDTRNGLALAQVTSTPQVVPDLPESALRTIVHVLDLAPWSALEVKRKLEQKA